MSTPSPRVVLQAHATRSLTALTLLLHGRSRSPLQTKPGLGPVIVGVVLTVLIAAVTAIVLRISAILPH